MVTHQSLEFSHTDCAHMHKHLWEYCILLGLSCVVLAIPIMCSGLTPRSSPTEGIKDEAHFLLQCPLSCRIPKEFDTEEDTSNASVAKPLQLEPCFIQDESGSNLASLHHLTGTS